MKALQDMTMREAAQEIYDFARECAEQEVICHVGYYPWEDEDEYTKDWECKGKVLDIDGIKLKVFASFKSKTTYEVLDVDYCTYLRTEFVDGTDEQYKCYTAYSDALAYELERITDNECTVE